jgi:LPS-assembly protein
MTFAPSRSSTAAIFCPHLLALIFSLALPLPLLAQDSNPAACPANTNSGTANTCETSATGEGDAPPTMDWVKIDQVPKDLADHRCRVCSGRYIDPLEDTDTSLTPEQSEIRGSASTVEIEGNTVHLTDGVSVYQGYRKLRGDTASIDRAAQSATIEGNIEVREPGVLIRGNRAEIQSQSGEALIEGSRYVLHSPGLRGQAEQLRRDQNGVVYLDNGSLTYCAPENNGWLLEANQIELNMTAGTGTARGASFEVGGVPIFYAPWLRFPLDDRRKTGFLWPDIGTDSRGGLDIAAPVYFNLAPNYDALYTPRYIQERGLNHEGELRYLNPVLGYWSAGGAFIADDDRYSREVPDARNHDRWLGTVQHNGLIDQRWRSQIDYSRVSDVDYLKDLDTSSLDTKRKSNLLQMAALDYLGDSWLINAQLQQFQTLADDIKEDYKKLPQITAQFRGQRAPFELEPIAQIQYSYFDSNEERVTGQRIYGELGLTYPMMWQSGFLNPSVKYRQLNYDLSDSLIARTEDSPSAGTGLVSLDGGLLFERSTRVADRGFLQTLEPRLYYLYSDYEDQRDQPDFDTAELTFNYSQLFRETRFSGRDRLDDANQLSIGVTTRFISDEDGREQFSASLGQILYFEDRKVRLEPINLPLTQSGSELAAEITLAPTERWDLRSSVVWDPYNGKVNSGNLYTSYTDDSGSLYNIGYTFRRPLSLIGVQPVTEQLHLSTFMPIADNWNLFASWNYSLEANTSVEDMFGVEYDSCCWKVRLLHLRYFDTVPGGTPDFNNPDLQRERSTQVQIVLKGLGGFGDRVEGLLEDMIRGYDEREY